MHGRIGRVEAARRIAALAHFSGESADLGQELARHQDRIDAQMRVARMRLMADDFGGESKRPLMSVHHFHQGRLAVNHGLGPRQMLLHIGYKRTHADAAHFLIAGESQMDGDL